MDYDVMYVDDGRNADHRRRPAPWGRPQQPRTVVVPAGTRPTVITSRPAYGPPAYGYQPAPFAARFGMSTGELIDTAIQILAAIQPLPVAPTAAGDAGIDVENLVLLCRARHKVTYAEHRIMPRRSSLSTEVHVIFAA